MSLTLLWCLYRYLEHISCLFLVFLLLTLIIYLFVGLLNSRNFPSKCLILECIETQRNITAKPSSYEAVLNIWGHLKITSLRGGRGVLENVRGCILVSATLCNLKIFNLKSISNNEAEIPYICCQYSRLSQNSKCCKGLYTNIPANMYLF